MGPRCRCRQLPHGSFYSYASLLLSIDSKGLIDCYHDGCNWQGVEYRQYDLRQVLTGPEQPGAWRLRCPFDSFAGPGCGARILHQPDHRRPHLVAVARWDVY